LNTRWLNGLKFEHSLVDGTDISTLIDRKEGTLLTV